MPFWRIFYPISVLASGSGDQPRLLPTALLPPRPRVQPRQLASLAQAEQVGSSFEAVESVSNNSLFYTGCISKILTLRISTVKKY